MGRKVHPMGFRLGVVYDWDARWYAEGERYKELLAEDLEIRELIREEMSGAGIPKIEIERSPNEASVIIHTARPGIVIGRRGANVNALRSKLEDLTGKRIRIDVHEVENPELNAHLVAENVVSQLERRVSYRRAMSRVVERAMRLGVRGIKVTCAGRLMGAEMARQVTVSDGKVPLQTLRADIDYAQAEALITYGRIGVKVWIYKGEIFPSGPEGTGELT